MVFLYHFAIPRKLNVEDVMGLNPSREFGELTSTGGKMVSVRDFRFETSHTFRYSKISYSTYELYFFYNCNEET